MSVRADPGGFRSVQVEVEVPGPPDRVWEAIASGPGISAWFVPTTFEMAADGTPRRITCDFGPSGADVVTVTAWEPPRRFVAESSDFIPDGPRVTTEWRVRERPDGSCVVGVKHWMAADSAEWDGLLEGAETGWPAFFENLKAYLT